MKKKFASTLRKGFHLTFENGLTASVQWGYGNYCDNRFNCELGKDVQSDTAEVAVFKGRDFVSLKDFIPNCPDDIVCGYLTPEQVVKFLLEVMTANPDSI